MSTIPENPHHSSNNAPFPKREGLSKCLIVDLTQAGKRLDKFLSEDLEPEVSRERVQQLIKNDCVQVDGKVVNKASFKLFEGQVLSVEIPENRVLEMPAWFVELDIRYEDEDLLVVNKPRGMLTHPTGLQQGDTLVNALLHHCAGQLSGINGVERPGIVHRIDRETEGLLVVAKSDVAHHGLAEQLLNKSMFRRYYAIVQGVPNPLKGDVRIGISRHPQVRNKMQADWAGKSAVTHYEVMETLNDRFAWVRCQLETGRTHQIRVHMAYTGNPLVCDPLYGTGLEHNWKELPQEGQALQAYFLPFIHPVTKKRLSFELEKSDYLLSVWNSLGSCLT